MLLKQISCQSLANIENYVSNCVSVIGQNRIMFRQLNLHRSNIRATARKLVSLFDQMTSVFMCVYSLHFKTRNFWSDMMRKLSVT